MRRNKILRYLILLALGAAVVYSSLDRIAVYLFAKSRNLEISYKKSFPFYTGELKCRSLTVLDRATGMGFFSESAVFKPGWNNGLSLGFALKRVHFIKKDTEKPAEDYDDLMQMVAMPFNSRWLYKEISGEIAFFDGGVKVRKFNAANEELKLSFTGDIYDNNTVKSDITIYFADSVVSKIPAGLTKVILADENNGWKSLSVHLEGNYKAPSIQVSSKRFRLNIKTVVESKT